MSLNIDYSYYLIIKYDKAMDIKHKNQSSSPSQTFEVPKLKIQ